VSKRTGGDGQIDVRADARTDARVGARTRRRFFGSLCGMVFLVNLARVVFAPLLEPLMVAFSMAAGTAGFVATLVWIGSALPRIPTGVLLTRVPRRHVVLGTGAVLTVSAVAAAGANSVATLAAGAFLLGLASGAYFIAANPLVSELYPERVGRAIGVHGTASQLAAVAAPLFVGVALAVGTWRTAFLALAGLAATATAVLYLVARRADALPEAGQGDRDFLAAARRQWPIIATAVAIIGASGFVWNGLFNFYVTYLTQVKLLEAGTARTLLTVVFAAGVPAFWFTGRLADRLPHVPLLLAILGAFVACLVALTVAQGLLALAVVTAVLGYAAHSMFPAIDTYLLDSLPDENRSSAYAAFSGSAMVIQATGSWVLGSLTDLGYGFDSVFLGAAVGLAVVLAALVSLQLAGRLPSGATTT
jgi:predicted MFS family arabinose efflux permease